tara:strand:+ start:243 stop:605 length:363 start_codon:yes stop_codon:yes gene_type:complete
VKPETKFWQDVRKIKSEIRWTRLENLSSLGTPDLLGYNNNGIFFTVELKVTKTNKITISPHQIAFHLIHPHNTFILVKALLSKEVKLYEGSRIKDLVACGLKLEPCSLGLESSLKKLASL